MVAQWKGTRVESISIREAADRLGVSHKVVRRLISQGTLEAYKRPGAHGAEWRVEINSLTAYQSGQPAPRHGQGARVRLPAVQPALHVDDGPEPESWKEDKAFLQEQVRQLTGMLARSVGGGQLQGASEPCQQCAAPVEFHEITASLQSALRTVSGDGASCVELCSVKVLWGKPVLWRVAATDSRDVEALVGAVLSPSAMWSPPGEEAVFVWVFGPDGDVLWGTACGPGWFGPEFEEALRHCRVERR